VEPLPLTDNYAGQPENGGGGYEQEYVDTRPPSASIAGSTASCWNMEEDLPQYQNQNDYSSSSIPPPVEPFQGIPLPVEPFQDGIPLPVEPFQNPPQNGMANLSIQPPAEEQQYEVPPQQQEQQYEVPPQEQEQQYEVPPQEQEQPYEVPPQEQRRRNSVNAQWADQRNYSSGGTTLVAPEDALIQTPEGVTVVKTEDGVEIEMHPDGTKIQRCLTTFPFPLFSALFLLLLSSPSVFPSKHVPHATVHPPLRCSYLHRNPDGTVIEQWPDGTVVQIQKGIRLEKMPDGNRRTFYPDGMILEVQPDGTEKQTFPDGTVLITNPDGTMMQVNNDATIIEQSTDGDKMQRNPNGVLYELRTDGTKATHRVDGTTVEMAPDGTKVKKRFGQVVDVPVTNDDLGDADDGDLDLENKSSVQLRKICTDLGIPARTWDPEKLKVTIRAHFEKLRSA
jgi:hypothetical protein